MRILIDEAASAPSPDVLLVLLTGSYSQPEDFHREGFVAAVRERGLDARIALVGTPPAQVADGSIAGALLEEVVAPAFAIARRRLWLAGISLGGLAALAYAARHEADLEGLVLIAPYPGTRDVIREIDAAGGLASWRPGLGEAADCERDAWAWLATRGRVGPPAYLYYGESDRFADGQRRMGEALPADRVHRIPGGHDWPTWRQAWDRFLDGHGPTLAVAPNATAASGGNHARGSRP